MTGEQQYGQLSCLRTSTAVCPVFSFTNPSRARPSPWLMNAHMPAFPPHTPGVSAPVHGIDLGQVSPQRPPGAHLDSPTGSMLFVILKGLPRINTKGGTLPPPAPLPKAPSHPLCSVTPPQQWLCPAWLLPVSPTSLHRGRPAQAQQLGAGPEPPPPTPISALTGHPGPVPPASVPALKGCSSSYSLQPPQLRYHLTGLQKHRLLGAVCAELDKVVISSALWSLRDKIACAPTVHPTHKNLMFMTWVA